MRPDAREPAGPALLPLTIGLDRALPARAAEALHERLGDHFQVTVASLEPVGRGAPRVEIDLPLTAEQLADLPTLANLLSRPLYRALDGALLAEERRPIAFQFRFHLPAGTVACTVVTAEADVLKHAVDTLLEQTTRGAAALRYDEATGAWRPVEESGANA